MYKELSVIAPRSDGEYIVYHGMEDVMSGKVCVFAADYRSIQNDYSDHSTGLSVTATDVMAKALMAGAVDWKDSIMDAVSQFHRTNPDGE
jgi:hypothetical protein